MIGMPQDQKRTMKVPTGAVLSKYLRALALDIETTDESGDPITKAHALAILVWKHALGSKEINPKTGKEVVTPPATWAIEILYSRIEGKIPLAVVEDQGRSLTDKVSDLGKARINSLAQASAEKDDDDRSDSEA
jgi:hypothetical protein